MMVNALVGFATKPVANAFSRTSTNTADGTIVIPEDNNGTIRIKVWGAGGGGAPTYGYAGPGGGGGFVQCDVAVTPGETLIVKVGAGGSGGELGGYGGGLSGVFRGSVTQANALAVAGSGGGAAYADFNSRGGYGGGSSGGNGGQLGPYGSGAGGTQVSGGAQLATSAPGLYAGGGGAGYWGGKAGTASVGSYYGAGGGGSGYVTGTNTTNTAGSGATPANTGDSDYVAGKGYGGNGGYGSSGTGGLVVIQY